MESKFSGSPVKPTGDLDLGVALGQLQAFNTVAARCTAAQASLLVRVRDQRLYRQITDHWEQFCPEHLKMSRAEADKRIALWNEFGASYFDVSQYAPISAETYRLLEPSIKNGAIHLNDQVILLNPENARKVAGVVAEFRSRRRAASIANRSAKARSAKVPILRDVEDLQENIRLVVARFHSILEQCRGQSEEQIVQTALHDLSVYLSSEVEAFQSKCGGPL
jgi:hypothetical protein